jgi:capsular polysaccharide biosynthesis protein
MSEQSLDMRRALRVMRRYKALVGIAALVGLLAGLAYAVLRPPLLTSRALVVLPPEASQTIGTQVLIADSYPVLAAAAHRVQPPVPLQTLSDRVQAARLSSQIIAISGQGTTAAQAENTANTVAHSYVAYISSANPSVRMAARVLQPATSAARTSAALRFLISGLLGAVIGFLVGAVSALIIGRGDRRLRGRDEIADAIGVPVLAAPPTEHPGDAAGWARLLEGYEPGAVEAWNLRKALFHLGLTDARDGNATSLAVLSLSTDRKALALGPQLAAYAASLGIPTAFVLDPQQDANVTATLRTACAAASAGPSQRLGRLWIGVRDDDRARPPGGVPLTVVTSVVDAQAPQVAVTMRTTVTVLGVSAGAATAEQLARVAVSAAGDGRQIAGILVANPDPADHSAGHQPDPGSAGHQRRPTRLTGSASETSW